MRAAALRAGAIIVAFTLDQWLGEPPSRLHPVVWMGKALGASGAPWPNVAPRAQFLRGVACWIGGAGAVWAVAGLAAVMVRGLSLPQHPLWTLLAQILLLGLALKPLLAWRMLRDEVAAVERALCVDLERGRQQLSRLVSRDTRRLSAGQVRESALESLAENLNDSLVAPLFWFALGGLPAAAVYRFANTADAMWGYRGPWEWSGKWAARADDVLSYVPARLAALLLALGAARSPRGLATMARVTPSPNGGWPMGMLALALGVRLSKPGVYALNAAGAEPGGAHTERAIEICTRAAWLAVGASAAGLAYLGWPS